MTRDLDKARERFACVPRGGPASRQREQPARCVLCTHPQVGGPSGLHCVWMPMGSVCQTEPEVAPNFRDACTRAVPTPRVWAGPVTCFQPVQRSEGDMTKATRCNLCGYMTSRKTVLLAPLLLCRPQRSKPPCRERAQASQNAAAERQGIDLPTPWVGLGVGLPSRIFR